ncbi:MAG TPA: carboxypeptidase-like regulatory domain-containing protein, partial [Candidatus Acidoferrum sp.]|nr:carboxypeptidase-like regulatory domain-containing protein [Candidatus Acidoferrum sp.]
MKRIFQYDFKNCLLSAFIALITLSAIASRANAQASASIWGYITDESGAAVASAAITVKNIETGAIRTTKSNALGNYLVLSLLPGRYEINVSNPGFKVAHAPKVDLSVVEEARLDVTLYVAAANINVVVTSDTSLVNTSTSDSSGLVTGQQVKDLPLNGRSYDLLLPLNPGIVNFTSQKTGGNGISNSTTANNFSVSGNRPQQNLFLLNGVEFTGAAENNMTPGGTSGQLLGVDAVREFNVQRDSYGAEFGKKPGGQVIIVTRSGSNQLHGALFEFLKNNALDAPNVFDQGNAPPFQRNQFGATLGGPIRKDKTFAFGNYEGFRQHLHQTSAAFVPDLRARAAAVSSVQPLLNLWPTAAATDPDFPGTCTPPTPLPADACGIAEVFSSPLQTIREDFGTVRVDHISSSKDTFSTIYTADDGEDFTETPLDPFSADIETLREQVLSIEETHVFSSSLLNTARFGFSRAGYFFT